MKCLGVKKEQVFSAMNTTIANNLVLKYLKILMQKLARY